MRFLVEMALSFMTRTMAKIVPTAGEMSGKLGGWVFSRNKGGMFVRAWARPTNPNTARQQAVRSILQTQSGLWAGLTPEQQSAWETWAANNPLMDPLGQEFIRTGHQAFTGLRARQADAALTLQDEPPAANVPVALDTAIVTFTSETAISIAFTPAIGTTECIYCWMSLPFEAAADPNFRQSILIGYSAQAQVTPAIFTLPVAVSDGFGANFWTGVMDEDGQVSVALKDRKIYTAA